MDMISTSICCSWRKGWLHEVREDLTWLQTVEALPFELPQDDNGWMQMFSSLADCSTWKRTVKRACAKHLMQERIAWEVQHYHDAIYRELCEAGIDIVDLQASTAITAERFRCRECPKEFDTAQKLALHAFRRHGHISTERFMIQSTVCAGCLKDFHTTWRVQQHLRYRPNGCWDRLDGARPPAVPEVIQMPDHLKHIKRLPAIRRHYGPIRPTSVQRRRIDLRRRISELQQAGANDYVWWHPSSEPALVARVYNELETRLREWCLNEDASDADFQNLMFGGLFAFDEPDMKMARVFIQWIESRFHDCWPESLDPDRRIQLEAAYMDMLVDLPTWTMREEMKKLTQLWCHLPNDEPEFEKPRLPTTSRPYDRSHKIPSSFGIMQVKETERLQWRFLSRAPKKPIGQDAPYYVVHLYSGRRREGDFHSWMSTLLQQRPDLPVRVLSIDTAIHSSMNIHSTKLWTFLMEIAKAGRLVALLLGPPCETWSAARFETLIDQALGDRARRAPRPLRMADAPWCIQGLSLRELLQLSVGNALLLRGLWLGLVVALNSGAVVLEHPAMPHEPCKPSIWRTALVLLLVRRPNAVFYLKSIQQWRFGSPGVKPTTFLCANLTLDESLAQFALGDVQKPSAPLIGLSSTGVFRTSAAKEYPSALNRALANAMFQRMCRHPGLNGPVRAHDDSFGQELAAMSACLDGGDILPDFQPECANLA